MGTLPNIVTNLDTIKAIAATRQQEHDAFRIFIKNSNSQQIDELVHTLNNQITPQIDCTQCGNCCKSLMINVTPAEASSLATHLQTNLAGLKEKYLEESQQGQLVINQIPCHFLTGTRCSIYEQRFTECRDFPHLHKPNFANRLFGLLIHYAACPIIFNVIEALKIKTGFTYTQQA
ncbi:MAG: hypothetical protein RL172_1129 [Bacteroidota bacterium]|jgi:uncharacterized protein